LAEYRDRLLQRNKELTSDDEDDIDAIIGGISAGTSVDTNVQNKKSNNKTTQDKTIQEKTTQSEASDSYKAYADKLEDVLKGINVGTKAEEKLPEKKPDSSLTGGNQKKTTKKTTKASSSGGKKEGVLPAIKTFSRLYKWAVAAAVLLIVFICVTIAYVSANARYKYNQMDIREIAEKDLVVNSGVSAATKGYTTLVLYGVDSRESNLNAGTNSDSIIIVSIENETKQVKLVSVYRDTIVQIQNDAAVTNKVNYAYQLGGALMSINTLNANLDLNITDYITVDFNAMANIINALGGVEIDIKEEEINNLNKNLAEQIGLSGVYSDGVHEAGVQTLNGQQAVAYSRIRSTAGGDITRTERQRSVLTGLIDKAMHVNKDVISNLIDVSFEGISTSFTKAEITKLAKDIGEYSIVGNTGFPFSYEFASLENKGSVIVASDMSSNTAALHEYLYGESNYTPSSTVGTISSELTSETGVSAATVTVPDDNSGEASGDSSTNNSDGDVDGENAGDSDSETDNSSATDTLTAPPEGMLENE
jgi:LCP family protein required for cell wall assembly